MPNIFAHQEVLPQWVKRVISQNYKITTYSLFHLFGTVSAIPDMPWIIDTLICNSRFVAILREQKQQIGKNFLIFITINKLANIKFVCSR